MPEAKRNFIDIVHSGFKLAEVTLPTSPIEEAINQAVEVYCTQRAQSTSPIELLNYFGNWQATADEQVLKYLANHLQTIDTNCKRMDASRSLDSISISLYRGIIPQISPFDWVMDLATAQTTGLGDGTAFYIKREGWNLSQVKGKYFNTSHVLIRQKKA